MSDISVTPPKMRLDETPLSAYLNLPCFLSNSPPPSNDIKPLIELSKCKSVTITNSGNRYPSYSEMMESEITRFNHNHLRLDPYFLIGCIVALIVLMVLIIIGYWVIIRKTDSGRIPKKFIQRCIYGIMIVIFTVILFLFYLILI